MTSQDIFDGLLMNVVQKAEGIDGFYDAVFGFMRRKTDFFTFPDKAKATVLESFTKHAQLFKEDKDRQELIKQKQEEKKRKEENELKAKQKQAETKPPEPESKVEEITDEEAEKLLAQDSGEEQKKDEPASDTKTEGEGDDKDDGTPPLIGNGLRTDKYSFTQTLSDITINVFLPQGIKGKDLNVVIQQKHLKVQIKGQNPIIDGELPERINSEEAIWTVDTIDGERVWSLTLDKADKMKWWESAIVGDQKINTKKIEPENSKLSDLDSETRQTVEKMMFDQQQKQKGLPTSDELEKREKLQAFMAAHPEMDFSKAKFS